MSLCEEDCTLEDYDSTNKRVKCSCLVKINFPLFEEIKFDKKKLYQNFKDINNIANIKFLKCYKNVFVLNSLKNNYGFFIYIIIYLLFFVCLLLFSCKYYFKLQKEIDEIIEAKNEEFQISEDKIKMF